MRQFASTRLFSWIVPAFLLALFLSGSAMAEVNSAVDGRALIAGDPEDPAGYIALGEYYLRMGNYAEAATTLQTGRNKALPSADLLVSLSRVYEAQEAVAKAEAAASDALQIDPDHVAAHLRLGEIYFRMNWPTTGLERFRQAVALAPDQTEPKVKYVGGLLEAGQIDQAEQACLEYVSVDPENVDLWLSLGQILEKQEKRRAAFTTYGQILVLDPENSTAFARQGRLFCQFGQYQAAETACRKALELDEENALAHAYLGIACSYLGQNNEARKHAEIAEKAGLNMVSVWKKIGQ